MLKRTGSIYDLPDDADDVIRSVVVEKEGIKFECERRDPYGFWFITSPPSYFFESAFSTTEARNKAIDAYLQDRNMKMAKARQKNKSSQEKSSQEIDGSRSQ
jgi:hypothetical protein